MTYPALATLRVPAAGFLHLRWAPHKAPYKDELDVLMNYQNPLHPRVLDAYQRVPPDVLRWKFVTNTSKKVLKFEVLRKHLRRRWEQAFLQALRDRGYDKNGRAAEGSKSLKGTLEAYVYGGKGMDAPWPSLVGQAGAVLDKIKDKRKNGEVQHLSDKISA